MVSDMITVMTIEEFYKYGTNDDFIIIDEYDTIIDRSPYTVIEGSLSGIWSLKDKWVVAFSATTSPIYERLIHNCIRKPKVLKFKSEFELVNEVSPI